MDHRVLEKHQLFLLWQNNFIKKIIKVWFWNLMPVIREVLMLLGNRSRALLVLAPCQGNIFIIKKS